MEYDEDDDSSSSSLSEKEEEEACSPDSTLPLPPLSLSAVAIAAAGSSINGNGCPFSRYPSKSLKLSHICSSSSSISNKPGRKTVQTGLDKACVLHFCKSVFLSLLFCCFLLQASVMLLLMQNSSRLFSDKNNNNSNNNNNNNNNNSSPLLKLPEEYSVKFIPVNAERISGVHTRRAANAHALRHPQLALVSMNLEYTPEALYLITIAESLQALGYKLELYAFLDGPMRDTWKDLEVPVSLLSVDETHRLNVDWLNFQGVIAISLSSKVAVSSLMQEPFKKVRVIWIIFEGVLGQRLRDYQASGSNHLFFEWKQAFKRADAVIFPNHALAMLYSLIDTGNFLVIPGSPLEVWEADQFMATHSREDIRKHFGLQDDDIAIAIVGSPFTYKWTWREHALIMKSFLPVIEGRILMKDNGLLKMLFFGGGSTCNYESALKAMAHHLGFMNGTVSYHCGESHINSGLWASDVVIYSSLREEQAFPDVLIRAMAFGKLIIAPNNTLFQTYITDGVSGFLYEFGNVEKLRDLLTKVIPELLIFSKYFYNITSVARMNSNGIFVGEVVRGYSDLLDKVIQFPSETLLPKSFLEFPEAIPKSWLRHFFKDTSRNQNVNANVTVSNGLMKILGAVLDIQSQVNKTFSNIEESQAIERNEMDLLSYGEWVEDKALEKVGDIERYEEDELLERHDKPHSSWEEIYRSVKRIKRPRDELHERDDGELGRTGQILCIYEPYLGSGAWPFLHQTNSLYRGISLLPKQRRPGYDDIDAVLRLPLLNNSYYRDAFCEFGTFLSLAYQIDRIHKNAWIGFQSWRAKGRKVALSGDAEKKVINALHLRTHGDAVYFWAKLDDFRYEIKGVPTAVKDFWLYCDAVNGNSCRSGFNDAFKHMYGIASSWRSLPPMPSNTGTWAVLNCWIMPTSSFLEFVMFSRMFIDALDSQHYDEHTQNGTCSFGVTSEEERHCYCRLMELLVNVWAYHSARRMIYVDPTTGYMLEQHGLEKRRNRMWVKFFEFSVLQSMDEEMAEEADELQMDVGRWLWPHTGEIYSRRIHERERQARYEKKMKRKRLTRERLKRMRSRYKQTPLARS